MHEEKEVNIKLKEREIRYLIRCGVALLQNVSRESVASYCGFTAAEIVEITKKLKLLADENGIEM